MLILMFRLLTPPLFFFAVIMFVSDFRLAAIPFGLVGCLTYFIAEELKARG